MSDLPKRDGSMVSAVPRDYRTPPEPHRSSAASAPGPRSSLEGGTADGADARRKNIAMNDEHRENVHRPRHGATSPGVLRWTRGARRQAALGCVSVLLWAASGVAQSAAPNDAKGAAPGAAQPAPKGTPNPAARLDRPGPGKALPTPAQKKEAPPGQPGSARPTPGEKPAPAKKDSARAEEGARPAKGDAKGAKKPSNKAAHKERAAAREARAKAREAYREALRAAREDSADGSDPAARAQAVEEARKQLLDAHRKGPRPRLSPKRIAERDEKLEKALEQARANREERRKERLTQLEKAHGDKLSDAALQSELLRHAWRVARLERLIQIAEASRRTRLVKKGRELLQKENERHEARLAELTQGSGTKAKTPPAPAAKKGNE